MIYRFNVKLDDGWHYAGEYEDDSFSVACAKVQDDHPDAVLIELEEIEFEEKSK